MDTEKMQRIIQGLYGIAESKKMLPKESARFTLKKTIECLEMALKEHDKEICDKAIDEFAEKLIEKLQEEKQFATNDYNFHKAGGLRVAIENVKQIAAEYEVEHIVGLCNQFCDKADEILQK